MHLRLEGAVSDVGLWGNRSQRHHRLSMFSSLPVWNTQHQKEACKWLYLLSKWTILLVSIAIIHVCFLPGCVP